MHGWQRHLAVAVALVALLAIAPARALASDTEASMLMDDTELIYSGANTATQTLERLHTLGVDEVKVSLVWSLVAPDPGSATEPSFDAGDPGAYPAGAWARYDLIDRVASSLGMSVSLMVVGPAPRWAWAPRDGDQGPPLGRYPKPAALEAFVQAAATRYDGSYVPGGGGSGSQSSGSPQPSGLTLPSLPSLLGGSSAGSSSDSAGQAGSPLPAITSWEVWNEPNGGSWLDPYYRGSGRGRVYLQPAEYRGIVAAAWRGMHAAGQPRATFLIGETANVGVSYPLAFLRDLYCVGPGDRPLRGHAAAAVDCPTGGDRASFLRANPGLFGATGWSHHPYGFDTPPNRRYHNPSFITIDNLATMEGTLRRIFSAYGIRRGVGLYLTEWGYDTDPPNPYHHTTLTEAATWLDQGEYMTWRDPYVRVLAQFELVDSAPDSQYPKGSSQYWGTFQTGLEFLGGRPKPSFWAFMLPIWLPQAHTGRAVTVWGQLRPADHGSIQYGELQLRPLGRHQSFSNLQEVQTTSSQGFFLVRARILRRGALRLAWLDPANGVTYYSRIVPIS